MYVVHYMCISINDDVILYFFLKFVKNEAEEPDVRQFTYDVRDCAQVGIIL